MKEHGQQEESEKEKDRKRERKEIRTEYREREREREMAPTTLVLLCFILPPLAVINSALRGGGDMTYNSMTTP